MVLKSIKNMPRTFSPYRLIPGLQTPCSGFNLISYVQYNTGGLLCQGRKYEMRSKMSFLRAQRYTVFVLLEF